MGGLRIGSLSASQNKEKVRFVTDVCSCLSPSRVCNSVCSTQVAMKNQTSGTASGPEGRKFGAANEPIRCHPSSESAALRQEVHEDQINGCSEEVEEWEELEFRVDSGASATVVGKEEVRAVQASEPDTSVHYRLADGS